MPHMAHAILYDKMELHSTLGKANGMIIVTASSTPNHLTCILSQGIHADCVAINSIL